MLAMGFSLVTLYYKCFSFGERGAINLRTILEQSRLGKITTTKYKTS